MKRLPEPMLHVPRIEVLALTYLAKLDVNTSECIRSLATERSEDLKFHFIGIEPDEDTGLEDKLAGVLLESRQCRTLAAPS
jgi:hypothetical protein